MNRRLILAGLSATGGLVTTAFLQVAVAVADVSATGADAFTIGSYTFDPFTVSTTGADVEGFAPVDPLSGAAPLLTLGGGTALGIPLARKDFEVFNPTSGTDLGSIDTNETVTSLFGLTNAEFTVASDTPAAGGGVGAADGGIGLRRVQPGQRVREHLHRHPGRRRRDTVTDTLVTPNGDVNLDSLFGGFDAAAPLQPGDAFTGLETGDSSIGADAFSIGGVTLDPTLRGRGRRIRPGQPTRHFSAAAGDRRWTAGSHPLSLPKASMSTAALELAPPTSGPLTPARM